MSAAKTAVRAASKLVMVVEVMEVSVGHFPVWTSSSEGAVLVVSPAVEALAIAIWVPGNAGRNDEKASIHINIFQQNKYATAARQENYQARPVPSSNFLSAR
jgi:hypothetical protein